MGEISLNSVDLPEETRDVLERYLNKVSQEWQEGVEALLLFGSAARGDFILGRSNINIAGIFRHLPVKTLQKGGSLHRNWGKHQIVAPLMMTLEDLQRSADVFPLEMMQMKDHHVLLQGRNPLLDFTVNEARLPWQCQQEVLGNLFQVRQRYIEGEGRIEAIQALLILSMTALLPCLRGLLKLMGQSSQGADSAILERFHETASFDTTVLSEVLQMKRGLASPGKFEWPKLYERYLESLEQLDRQCPQWCG